VCFFICLRSIIVSPLSRTIYCCSLVAVVCALDDALTVWQRRRMHYAAGSGYSALESSWLSPLDVMDGGAADGDRDAARQGGGGESSGSSTVTAAVGSVLTALKSRAASCVAVVTKKLSIRRGPFAAGGEMSMVLLSAATFIFHLVAFAMVLATSQVEVLISVYNGYYKQTNAGTKSRAGWAEYSLTEDSTFM
jgi:hypothetical protein